MELNEDEEMVQKNTNLCVCIKKEIRRDFNTKKKKENNNIYV